MDPNKAPNMLVGKVFSSVPNTILASIIRVCIISEIVLCIELCAKNL